MARIGLEEERLSLRDAAKLLDVDLSTVWRWTLRGVRGHTLPSLVIGGRRYVARADLEEFIAAQNQPAGEPPRPSPSATQRNAAASKKAAAILGE